MEYILNSGETVEIEPPMGLTLALTSFESDSGSITITPDSGGSITIPGTDPLPISFFEKVTVTANGGTVKFRMDKVNGDQIDTRTFEHGDGAAFYPGKWGSGIGSKKYV